MIGLLLAHGFEGAAWPSRETSPHRPSQRHRARQRRGHLARGRHRGAGKAVANATAEII
jgi:hypothetical protein